MNTVCLCCGKFPTIDAHIIPKAVVRNFRRRGPDKKTIAVLGDRAIVARDQNGAFDSHILCRNCDGKIGVADKWFVENLERFHSASLGMPDYLPTFVAVDSRMALQFATSVVYRASLSRLSLFVGISLGPYERLAGEISIGSATSDSDYPIVLINVLCSETLDTRQFVTYPVKCSSGNGQYFVFSVSGVQFLVKFGGNGSDIGTRDEFTEELRVRPDADLVICCYPFHESAEREMFGHSRDKFRR